jgi:hypothetical protein
MSGAPPSESVEIIIDPGPGYEARISYRAPVKAATGERCLVQCSAAVVQRSVLLTELVADSDGLPCSTALPIEIEAFETWCTMTNEGRALREQPLGTLCTLMQVRERERAREHKRKHAAHAGGEKQCCQCSALPSS